MALEKKSYTIYGEFYKTFETMGVSIRRNLSDDVFKGIDIPATIFNPEGFPSIPDAYYADSCKLTGISSSNIDLAKLKRELKEEILAELKAQSLEEQGIIDEEENERIINKKMARGNK